ncbi:MAG: M56 family metallopeptidase [Sphingomicrobium sp.]
MTGAELSTGRYVLELLFNSPVSQLWPMLLLPAIAALASDKIARKLPATRADWRAAALLTACPGLVMLAVIAMVAVRSATHMHPDDHLHFLQYHVPFALAVALVGRAAWRLYRRNSGVRALKKLARAASPRLERAAAQVSVPVREIDDDGCECFVAGALQPCAYVSRGVLKRMTDEELLAALHHERAHASSHDPAMLALLTFLGDLAPGTDRALTLYRQARERRADSQAAERAGPCVLASALLAVSRGSTAPAAALGMSGSGPNTWRLQAILGVEPEVSPMLPGGRLWRAIGLNLALTGWPVAHMIVVYRVCYP